MEKRSGIDFIKELRSYGKEEWFTKLVDIMMLKKGSLSDKDRESVIGILLGEEAIEDFEEIEVEDSFEQEQTNSQYSLVKLHNINNVGALKENSEITFSPHLTVIYGKNGAGKSSYFKALSVFSKRAYQIKGYINQSINNDGNEKRVSLSYCNRTDHVLMHHDPTQQIESLSQEWISTEPSFISGVKEYIDIFDNENIDIVVKRGKNLDWKLEPFKLHYFEILIKEVDQIQVCLDKKISENERTVDLIQNNLKSVIKFTEVIDLLNNSDSMLDSSLFTPLTTEELTNYEQLLAQRERIQQNSNDKIRLLTNETINLNRIKDDLNKLAEKDSIQAKQKKLELEYNEAKDIEETQQLSALRNMDLAHIDKVGWQEFIGHAVHFIKSFEYPRDNDTCIFCNQALDQKASELVEQYKNLFLQNNNHLEKKKFELTQIEKKIEELKFLESRLISEIVGFGEQNKELLASLRESDGMLESAPTASPVLLNKEQIQTYLEILDQSIKEKEEEIERCKKIEENRIIELEGVNYKLDKIDVRKRVIENKESFEMIYELIQLNSKHKKLINALSTVKSNITKKQNEATTKLQIDKFNELFNTELQFFKYKFSIDSKVKKGRLDRKYFGEELNIILSEGEKNLLGLADFFADINYYEDNCNPIILDDPITSFDLDKIDLLSERIVTESKKRQVIVFTHSKPFVTALKNKVSFENGRRGAKCKLCSDTFKCNETTKIFCAKWYEVYSYEGLSGVLAEVLPYQAPKHLKERIEGILASPCSSAIDTLEGFFYLRLMIEFFIDTCLLNSVRSRLDPEEDNINWDKLHGLKVLVDNDGKKGSNSIIRRTYSKISGISVHIDKNNQTLTYNKSDLLDELDQMRNHNNEFKAWYNSL
ncbi:AAA family ATPase [Paenibacillus vini]|uniref:Rad50/SbcC-type AAA domain-containing protein n=1 Tax=Paenibacillus vini TaxID=1476024 RepID=A0ABQ4MH67_9BACL|nr:hypothetical protein [Paenibacillus vini]GIP55316.1 hypothetical protein J42TS3_43510 [Paenibacillus vini]